MNVVRLLALTSLSLVAMSHSCNKQADAVPCEGTPTTVAAQACAIPTGCSLAALRGETKTYVSTRLPS
ncbi:MAG: hypothetical protein EOO62_32180 [Hymenobacter sp.]|nr:MAG: hypothetical protein EOO62_32180 [Hymenobacter sp.]